MLVRRAVGVTSVSDDCSSPGRFAAMQELVGDDPRFVVSRGGRRLGFYRNFERALAMAPAGARYVAMSDQDDVWNQEKLEVLLREIGDAQLVYSDARVVDPRGRVLAGTYWDRRRNNHSNLLSLLVANAVTGALSGQYLMAVTVTLTITPGFGFFGSFPLAGHATAAVP